MKLEDKIIVALGILLIVSYGLSMASAGISLPCDPHVCRKCSKKWYGMDKNDLCPSCRRTS